MSQVLNLAIMLTPPPDGAHPEAIASIGLSCDLIGLYHSGDLLIDPITKAERGDLRWYLEEYWKWPYEQFLERGKKIEALLPEIGKRLYMTVFGSVHAQHIWLAWRLFPDKDFTRQISIMSDIPRALSMPWELMRDDQGFLVLRTRSPVSIIRRLPQYEMPALFTQFEPPLRILLVVARPSNTGFTDPRGIAGELFDELQGQIEAGSIELEYLRPPTLRALRARLADSRRPLIHVLHFDGHGVFEEGRRGQGALAFEDDKGRLALIKAEDVAQVLQDSGVQLAVLTAAQSAMSAADDVFSSVAARLIRSGMEAVIAMSASVLPVSTIRYTEVFYHELAHGTPVPIAQERARQSLYDNPLRHLHRRRSDEEGTPVELLDWWVPHFYQQRPLSLQPSKPTGRRKKKEITSFSSRLNMGMPVEPRYGFSGRAQELHSLERWLMQGKMVMIHGFGGIGKTALAREIADWLTRTRMYDRACFISFEHGGDASMLLAVLGNYLEVYDGYYNPNNSKSALAQLRPTLKKKRTLVIADSLESILPSGEAPLEEKTRTHLWEVLLELKKMGTGVLLTSRDATLSDKRMLPESEIAELSLQGLNREDAYAFASRILIDLEVDRASTPYLELRDLLAQLDHHPLAIQLVLPALRELSISKIKADFGMMLSKFVDNTETGRNRSLLASLDSSLRRLSEQQRELLRCLSYFRKGASEGALLVITEIPRAEWVELRSALEQAALMTTEQVDKNIAVPFLRFHPILAPYIHNLPGADEPMLRARYIQLYYVLAKSLFQEDDRNPQFVRAMVQRELPNLTHALELQLEADNHETVPDMAKSIAKFLMVLGLERERDMLWRRVGNSAKTAADKQEEDTLPGGTSTQAEWERQRVFGEYELSKGNIHAASTRFTALLKGLDGHTVNVPMGRGSYEHCVTLHRLASCLDAQGQSAAAEERLYEALVIIDTLLRQHPGERIFILQRFDLLISLGNALLAQGLYAQARNAYQESWQVYQQADDRRSQATVLGQLGTLALMQRNYAEAKMRYMGSFQLAHDLDEPAMKAAAWHRLGVLAREQEEWTEAERCLRESLELRERVNDRVGAAETCNQLALVAQGTGRTTEAEGWLKRTLELDEEVQQRSPSHASHLNNLARLLVDKILADPTPAAISLLVEARNYAERALAIQEKVNVSSEIWKTLDTLADIADLTGQAGDARNYRCQERETFATFQGNRYLSDRQHWPFIADIVAAMQGDMQVREILEKVLPKLQEHGQHFYFAILRLWAGERDWHSLAGELELPIALLVLRVLETLAQFTDAQYSEARNKKPEEIDSSLSSAVREAIRCGDKAIFEQALKDLASKA